MANSFIPNFHFVSPATKLTNSWCWDAIQWTWYQTNNRSLLWGKKVDEINGYASGDFDITPFKKMYKSQAKAIDAQNETNQRYLTAQSSGINMSNDSIGFVPLPLIPTKLNSAIAIVQKIPVEVTATALDPLAAEKKQEDLVFLKNKPALEADLQEIADQMQIGKVDLGNTKHSAVPFSNSPYGLDLTEPDELQVFVDLLYNLAVEAAFETVEQEFWDIKHGSQIKLLEIRDQLKFGISCHRGFQSAMTGLPDIEYEYPGTVETPYSDLPDFSDNSHRFIHKRITVMELFNYFSNEICNEETLYNIINGKEFGYCACNNMGSTVIPENDFSSFKINLVYCEIKSIDYVGIASLNKKSKFNYVVTDGEEAEKCSNKVWGQNTYGFWWLQNTKYFYGIHRLGFSHRTQGLESYQNFSTNIYKSQQKSAVELSIGENKKAQIADIKMQHAIIMSLPAGKYVDLKYLRGALSGLVQDENNKYTLQDLINLALEKNIMIGDTEGFEGKNDGQLKPFQDIPGGVKSEVIGYIQVILDASQKISQFTGINDQLTGQSQNPEGLIGLEKLRINASINALNYVNEAIENQYQKLFTNWSSIIQAAVERGGKTKEAIVNLIGAKKVSLIDALDDLPLHTMGIKVTIKQREEERQEFREELNRLKINGVISTVDIYMLDAISNPKDKMALLAVKFKQWQKRQERQRAEDMANQQAMIQAQGENAKAAVREKVSGEIQKIYKQGEVSAHILQLAAQLGIQDKQLDFIGKKALQQDRGQDQISKSVQTLETKSQLENQKALV